MKTFKEYSENYKSRFKYKEIKSEIGDTRGVKTRGIISEIYNGKTGKTETNVDPKTAWGILRSDINSEITHVKVRGMDLKPGLKVRFLGDISTISEFFVKRVNRAFVVYVYLEGGNTDPEGYPLFNSGIGDISQSIEPA